MIPDRAWFQTYLDAFNRNDFEEFGAYYTPDVAFFGQAATLDGRDAVLAFYRMVKARVEERIDLLTFHASEGGIAAEIRTSLLALEDWPDFPTGPLLKGQQRQSINFAFYDVVDSRFTRIRSARFRRIDTEL
jgi:hypothetical protein